MVDVVVVGMPRAGSVAFHRAMTEIGAKSGAFTVVNRLGIGRQHVRAQDVAQQFPVLAIHRDLLDALVSAYFFIRDSDRHRYAPRIEGRSKAEALDVLADDYLRERCVEWLDGYRARANATLFEYETVFHGTELARQFYVSQRLDAAGLKVPPEVIWPALNAQDFEALQADNPIHYREGKVGTFRDHLTAEQIARIRRRYSLGEGEA